MIKNAELLCEENKLRCDDTHYYNDNFFLSDELALFILG
jgi:oxygen-independent coproporphyrinogen-3 oxidase